MGGREGKHITVDDAFPASVSSLCEHVEGIERGQDLHGADGVEHVGVMAGSGAEAAAGVLAGQDEVDDLVSRQGVGMAQQMKGGQAPVQATDSKMLREPVIQVVMSLITGRQSCAK